MSRQIATNSAAELPGNPFELGIYHAVGKGGQVNLIEAHKWFNIAAASGDREAALHRNELAGEMSRKELAAALKAAREWTTHH